MLATADISVSHTMNTMIKDKQCMRIDPSIHQSINRTKSPKISSIGVRRRRGHARARRAASFRVVRCGDWLDSLGVLGVVLVAVARQKEGLVEASREGPQGRGVVSEVPLTHHHLVSPRE